MAVMHQKRGVELDIARGLTHEQVMHQRMAFGRNVLPAPKAALLKLLWRQVNNPLLLVLVVTALVAQLFGDHANATVIICILGVSTGLGFWNEFSSERTIRALEAQITHTATVIRGGEKQEIAVSELVLGDVMLLHQGSLVPADLELLEARELSLDESPLTGESAWVSKKVNPDHPEVGWIYMGTTVTAGSGKAVVRKLAFDTQLGRVSAAINRHTPSSFQLGLANLSKLLARVVGILALVIGVLNIALGRDPLQAVLFALSIAIGLTPALLPVIVTVAMAKGAADLAKKNVVVRKLTAIDELGSIDILCTDKTGTLTEGGLTVTNFAKASGDKDDYVLQVAAACTTASVHHKIIGTPIDVAILQYVYAHHTGLLKGIRKLFEQEFSFEQRGQFVVISRQKERLILFKGAAEQTLARCTMHRNAKGKLIPLTPALRREMQTRFRELNEQGLRVIAVAQAAIKEKKEYGFEDAKEMELLGHVSFADIPKASAARAIHHLASLGVSVRVITGDNEIVTKHVCEALHVPVTGILTGAAIEDLSERELERALAATTIFARVSPEQKARIITAFRKSGHVVAYLGDGVNDAAALHAADVGISVDTAVDVAKQAAGVVLLRKGLDVIADGVIGGRRILANTVKYVLMGTSSNFGNMISMAGASLFFPFLPMTPTQVLLGTTLYDISQLTIPTDRVDDEDVERPHPFAISQIYQAMLRYGLVSTVFDYLTFGFLWFTLHASGETFQTGWFVMSAITQTFVVLIIRTWRKPFWRSAPSLGLAISLAFGLAISVSLPYTEIGSRLGMVPLPRLYWLGTALLLPLYLGSVEIVKGFWRRKLLKEEGPRRNRFALAN